MAFFKKYIVIIILCFVSFSSLAYGAFVLFSSQNSIINKFSTKDFVYGNASVASPVTTVNTAPQEAPVVSSVNPPAVFKAIYITGWSAGNKSYLSYLDNLFKTTQVNAVIIDVKDYSGVVSYDTGAPQGKAYKAYWPEIPDIDALIKNLHAQGIYVIGRVVVFEDPMLAKNRPDLAIYDTSKTTDTSKPVVWENSDGLAWMDPSSKEVWDYNVAIAKDALSHGFDEINFDYVRFPTDGNANVMGFPVWDGKTPKYTIIKSFFAYLRQSLPNARISADIFGQTTTSTTDMGIGQIFEDSLQYFNYVCPMVYPSHYVDGFLGYKNPADYPYQIINYALSSAAAREKVFATVNNVPESSLAKVRPWLQDFNLGAVYDAPMVTQEIQATSDAMQDNYAGYMLWNPSNVYSQGAIAK